MQHSYALVYIYHEWYFYCFLKAKEKWFSSFDSSKTECNGFLWIHKLSGNAAITIIWFTKKKKEIVGHNFFITSAHLCINHSTFMLDIPCFVLMTRLKFSIHVSILSFSFDNNYFFLNHILFALQFIYIELSINV